VHKIYIIDHKLVHNVILTIAPYVSSNPDEFDLLVVDLIGLLLFDAQGETERDVASIGFRRLTIVRPGLLENRHGARLVERVSSALLKPIKLFRPTALSISTSAVAKVTLFSGAPIL
jgi:hypothetical protein